MDLKSVIIIIIMSPSSSSSLVKDFHPNFKSIIPNISEPEELFRSVGTKLEKQYLKNGRVIIPQHKWIYNNKLEFLKLNVKDIDRLYIFDNKNSDKYLLLGVRIEYKGKFLYIIFEEKSMDKIKIGGSKHDVGSMYVTTNPYSFLNNRIVNSLYFNSIYKSLREDGIIAIKNHHHRRRLNNNLNKNNNNNYGTYKLSYFEDGSNKSRVFNIFNNTFITDDI